MAVRYRLEKLNEVQYAYDKNRRAQLEAKGFRVVNTEGSPADKEDAAEEGGKPKTVKKSAGRTKAAKEEEKDAG